MATFLAEIKECFLTKIQKDVDVLLINRALKHLGLKKGRRASVNVVRLLVLKR